LSFILFSAIIRAIAIMEYILLGKSSIKVSRYCVGTWQASGWQSSDSSKFANVIKKALDLGVNFFDTAESYGDGYAEELLGKILKKDRHNLIIGTKFSHKNAAPEAARKAVENSLRRLKTDYIDLLQYHWPSPSVPLKETIEAMLQFKKEGKIRAIGVSNWNEPEWEEFPETDQIDSVQNCFSLLWRRAEKEVLPFVKKNHISFLAYSPLAQGILADRFSENTSLPKDPRRQNKLLSQERFEDTKSTLKEIRIISEQIGKPMAEVALRWVLDSEGVSVLIAGATNAEQLELNLRALDWKLNPEDIRKLSEYTAKFSSNLEPYDTLWGWHSRAKTKIEAFPKKIRRS
jgi:aryl-alcohol dehydrogenase-like predicted oxidoreductase